MAAQATTTAEVLVIFGITGDLAKKQTFRALYRLERRGELGCSVVGVARGEWSAATLRDHARQAIEDSIASAERSRAEADELLEEYRARLREAREQAEDIVVRARKAGEAVEDQAKADATKQREELMAAARRDIETETRRALEEIRQEVADLTVTATEKVTRKSLTPEDHRRLIDDALSEVDFDALAGGQRGRG